MVQKLCTRVGGLHSQSEASPEGLKLMMRYNVARTKVKSKHRLLDEPNAELKS